MIFSSKTKFIFTLFLVFYIFIFLSTAAYAESTDIGERWQFLRVIEKIGQEGFGPEHAGQVEYIVGTQGGNPVIVYVAGIINILLGILGVLLVILIIYGGIVWMTASGNEDQVKKARQIIISAIIGLIIILAAYSISRFVVTRVGGQTEIVQEP